MTLLHLHVPAVPGCVLLERHLCFNSLFNCLNYAQGLDAQVWQGVAISGKNVVQLKITTGCWQVTGGYADAFSEIRFNLLATDTQELFAKTNMNSASGTVCIYPYTLTSIIIAAAVDV